MKEIIISVTGESAPVHCTVFAAPESGGKKASREVLGEFDLPGTDGSTQSALTLPEGGTITIE